MVNVKLTQLSALLILASGLVEANRNKKQKSVIQLISDGFGPASETFARSLYQYQNGLPWTSELPQDKYVIGTIRTRSTDSLVTDSAASATAYSCGLKSVNAYIGVDSDKKPCGTNLEGAKAKGYNTALVTTSRITHATPASWSAHVPDRDDEATIADQQLGNYTLGRQVDLLLGGGSNFFYPNTTGGSRKDGRNLVNEAQAAGWQVVLNRTSFDALGNGTNYKYPTIGLFTKSHMSYEVDRNATLEPSLAEMAISALNSLKKANKPFFIMIEGARIDHAGHNNDPIGHYHDILAYQNMVTAVTQWVEVNDDGDDEPNITMLGTSDHECGGLTLALQRREDKDGAYLWYPDVVANGTHSTEYLSADFLKKTANATADEQRTYMVETIIKKGLGIYDANDGEIQRALDLSIVKDSGLSLTIWLSSLVNWRAHLGWSTTGHSGTDVNLYYYEGTRFAKKNIHKYLERLTQFKGNHENTWIGTWTTDYLQLDLAPITKKLNNGSDYSWNTTHGNNLQNFTVNLDKYHGGVARVDFPAASKQARRDNIGYSYNENLHLLRDLSAPSHKAGVQRSEL